jgi:hypothetical protein
LLAPPGRADAVPEAPGDAVLHLLHERGLACRPRSRTRRTWSPGARHGLRPGHLGHELPRCALPAGRQFAGQGFDCSGFTRHIFERSVGLVLPRRADEQARRRFADVKPATSSSPATWCSSTPCAARFSHVGIYVGDGKFIHSPRSGGQVRVEDMREAYWAKRFNGARRAELDTPRCPPCTTQCAARRSP